MEFNIKKCKLMYVGRSNRNFEYVINGSKLQVVDSEKDLGITRIMDDGKTSAEQCLYVYNKAIRTLRMIKRSITHKEKGIMVSLCKTLVRPHLEYCISAWSPQYTKDK